MKSIVPYEKEIKFGSKIAEICSISLEHELNIQEDELEGNFIITGEYKSHELSINKEKFDYKLPFSVSITDNIVKESVDFEINDFTYEIENDDTLKINIEFTVTALEQEKEEFREALATEVNEIFNKEKTEAEIPEPVVTEEPQKEEPTEIIEEKPIEQEITKSEEDTRIDKESEELIIGSASNKDDEYATYHIHIVKTGDTVETICTMYQIDVNSLKEYNNIENINIGDKIIIPEIDE